MVTESPWWARSHHADRRPLLLARGRMRDACRRYFRDQGFTEVECGVLQVSPGNETHLSAFATEQIGTDGTRTRLYLHTSPEFAAKKLLAAGETRIFDFARVFRNRERGPLHAREFTLLEWYRGGAPYDDVLADCLRLLALATDAARRHSLYYRDREADPHLMPERLSVSEAFRRHAQIDLAATLADDDGTPDAPALAAAAERADIKTAPDDTWSDMFSRILTERVEPELGIGRVTVLDRYPRTESALARTCADDPRFVERFELYACGVELANGFGELCDPAEQRKRFESAMDERERRYGERYPIDEDFLTALPAMGAASGVALGFDRLVMLATGAPSLDHVMWTPPLRDVKEGR